MLAGRFKGRALRVPEGGVTRPVRALVRRSIFDSLQGEIADARWLDLYAGSGSFGIEALSRGAAHATFVEAGARGVECLRANLAMLRLEPSESELLDARLPQLLSLPPPRGAPFDFVSMDPPFAISRTGDDLRALVEGLGVAGRNGWWSAGALLIWEEPADAAAPELPSFELVDRREYGTSRVRRFRARG